MQEKRGTWTLILESPIKIKCWGAELGLLGRGPFLLCFFRYAPLPSPSPPSLSARAGLSEGRGSE